MNEFEKNKNIPKSSISIPLYAYVEGLLRGIKHPIWDKYYTDKVIKNMPREKIEEIKGFYYDLDVNIISVFFGALDKLRNEKLDGKQKNFMKID